MALSFVSYDAQFTLIIRFKSIYISANSRYYVLVDCFLYEICLACNVNFTKFAKLLFPPTLGSTITLMLSH